jgi:hypothetical protein
MSGFKISFFLIVCLALLGLSSCRTAKVSTKGDVAIKPISTNKLLRNIENNAFKYDHLAIKKISCQFDNGKSKTSFKASILAEENKRITVMLSKLNIPVGRLWLTPDSVKFINYMEDTYFIDDYSYLSSLLDMDLDFELFNAIISNNILALRGEKNEPNNPEYETKIDSGYYVLESVTMLKNKRKNQNDRVRRNVRKQKQIITDAPVQQLIYVDPETYKLRKVNVNDPANSRNLNIGFSEYTLLEKQLYPGAIDLNFASPESMMQLKVKLSGFSLEKENEVRFKVPEKYTRVNTD